MINKIHCGDNIELMQKLPDNSVDMVITSPPYWGLRDYGECAKKVWGGDKKCEHDWGDSYTRHQEAPGKTSLVKQRGLEYTVTTHICTKCGAWLGQFGLEPHPQMYIDHLVEICREVKRILKPTGSFWLNMGDSYASGYTNVDKLSEKEKNWLQSKQLLMIPTRVAQALQEDEFILRNVGLWVKPNPMPISVKDRLNNTYEYLFFFVKEPQYFFDLDSIREPHKEHEITGGSRTDVNYKSDKSKGYHEDGEHTRENKDFYHPLGKNPGDVFVETTNDLIPDIPKFEEKYFEHIHNIDQLSKEEKRITYEGKNKDKKTGSSSVLSSTVTIRKVGREYIKEHNITGDMKKALIEYIQSSAGHPLGKNPGDVFKLKKERERQKEYTEKCGGRDHGSLPSGDLINHPLGKNPGDIFEVTVQPFADAHFAVFPPELVRKPIIASCPERICMECGEPWTREMITDVEHGRENKRPDAKVRLDGLEHVPNDWEPKQVKGMKWVKNCECESEYAPGIVLDIFNGSGTTCEVAKQLGRRYIGFDINSHYCEMARDRVRRVLDVDAWSNEGNRNAPIKGFESRKKTKKPGFVSISGGEKEDITDNMWDM